VTKRVLQNVHTDAISTFVNGAALELGTKADVDGTLGKRLDPTTTVFNVGDASKLTVPAGFEFVAPGGTEVWLAQETSPPSDANGYTQIWPGFSTESVPVGGVDGDRTTFTLTDIAMPAGASVELWRGSFGGTTRMWSTDENISSFEIGRTHMHANWAFTKPGTYTFTVTATATVSGVPVSATAPYTFVVGPVAPAAVTTTTLTAPATLVVGETAQLTAAIAPANATGWVEFLDGSTSLGHAAVQSGSAGLSVPALALGTHGITARYTPTLTNEFTASTSAPSAVDVTETSDSGVFGLKGIAASYASGDTLDVRAVNATLAAGDTYRWIIQKTSEDTSYVMADVGDAETTGHLVRPLDSSYDGAEIMVEIRGINPATGRTVTKSESAFYPISVTGPDLGSGEPLTLNELESQYYTGDNVTIAIQSRDLKAGESFHLVSRNPLSSVEWTDSYFTLTGEQPWRVPADVLGYLQSAVQLRSADGTVLGQSAAFSPEVVRSEVQLSGLKTVYRAGDTATASVEVYPARNDVTYSWALDVGGNYAEIPGQTGPTVSFDITAEMDGARLYVNVINTELGHGWGYNSAQLAVTDSAPGEQLLFFNSLAGHYHQGTAIALELVAEPGLADGESIAWSWKLRGQDEFQPVPGASGLKHSLVAEQALDGAEIRATLTLAGGETVDAKPATIYIDDHGAPANQKIAIAGKAADYAAGTQVSLKAEVAPASVLSRIEWLVQKRGDVAPIAVPGENGAEYSFLATTALDGAAVIARLTYDDGLKYVESAPVLLTVKPIAEIPTPEVPTPVIPTPEVPTPEVPTPVVPTPEVPTVPGTPDVPVAPVPDEQEPVVPSPVPTAPATPSAPEAPSVPAAPAAPAAPANPVASTPEGAPASRSAESLVGVPTGGVTLSEERVRVGSVVTLSLGAAHANARVAAWMFSTPVLLGGTWSQADANGRVAVVIPADADPGEHRIAVFDSANALVGWQNVTVLDASGRLADTGYALGAVPIAAGGLLLLAGLALALISRSRRASTKH
jgi:surface-anchored protein